MRFAKCTYSVPALSNPIPYAFVPLGMRICSMSTRASTRRISCAIKSAPQSWLLSSNSSRRAVPRKRTAAAAAAARRKRRSRAARRRSCARYTGQIRACRCDTNRSPSWRRNIARWPARRPNRIGPNSTMPRCTPARTPTGTATVAMSVWATIAR